MKTIAQSMWRAMGWACDEKSNAVISSIIKIYRWISTRWWHSLQTRMMKRYPENHAGWKYKLRRHNRGNVWDEMATEWAGEENWMRARRRKRTLEQKYQFVTFVLGRMKLSIEHRKKKRKGIGTTENTVRKLTTGLTLEHKDRGKKSLTDEITPRRGRR